MRSIWLLMFFLTSCLGETPESKQLRELKDIQKTLEKMKKDINTVKESSIEFGNIQLTRINRLEQLKKIVKESKEIEELSNKLRIIAEEKGKEKN